MRTPSPRTSAAAPWMSSSCTAEVSAFRIGGIRIRTPIGVMRKILVSSSSAAAALQQKNLKTLEIPNRKNSKSGGFFRVIRASTQTERHEDK